VKKVTHGKEVTYTVTITPTPNIEG
jgi:hypothetical protein